MAADDDDPDGDDFAFVALVLAGAYFFIQLYRYRLAGMTGGGVFEATAPADVSENGIAAILVPLQLSPTGAAFIKRQEGFRASAYADGKGHSSIGYGHQVQPGESFPGPITQSQADRLFAADAAAAAQAVSDGLMVEVSQGQFDALVDLAFNIGRAAFLRSQLLASLNAGDYQGAASQFSSYIHSSGAISPALVARRTADQNLFNGG